jgi:AmmeMemoRadiSam system protein B
VLCGSFDQFVDGEGDPGRHGEISVVLDVLKQAMTARKTIVVAAGDLAHVGPAFGDPYPIDFLERARLKAADEELMASICAGDEEAFLRRVQEEHDRRRICGLPPIYMALRLLGETSGKMTGYAQCPADQQGGSWVSICGTVFS